MRGVFSSAVVFLVAGAGASLASAATEGDKVLTLLSPDKRIEVKVGLGNDIRYGVSFQGRTILAPSAVALTLEGGKVLGSSPTLRDEKRRSVDETLRPVVRQK
ncbi:MAG: hypothetical protein FJY80_11915, partial [Candidatus Aminicenantes bacterium]|nr:hypothetical protein [Candidatus Aminicenantes bacterium]